MQEHQTRLQTRCDAGVPVACGGQSAECSVGALLERCPKMIFPPRDGAARKTIGTPAAAGHLSASSAYVKTVSSVDAPFSSDSCRHIRRADSARCSEFQQQKGGASEARYQPQASSNSSGSAKYQPQSSNASGASMAHPRYGDDDGEYGDEGAARAAPGKEAGPPTKAPGHARTGSGGIASAAAHKGKGGDGNGYVAIGTYGTPSTGAAARSPPLPPRYELWGP